MSVKEESDYYYYYYYSSYKIIKIKLIQLAKICSPEFKMIYRDEIKYKFGVIS